MPEESATVPPPQPRLRRHITASAVVAGVLFAAMLVVVLLPRGEAPTGPETPAPPTFAAQPQATLLVQVTLDRIRAASLLTASGGDPDEAVLLALPQDLLLVDGPTYTPLLDANLSLNRRLTVRGTENTLGVRVDGGWRMERKALAGFVDSVGGVTVELDAPLTFLDEAGLPVLELPPGTSRLTGPQASWYAIGALEGEDPVVGIQARFQEIFVAAVARLPSDPNAVGAVLTSLGALSDPLPSVGAVAAALLELRREFVADRVVSLGLPLRPSAAADPVVTRQELEGGPAAAIGAFRVADYVAAAPQLRRAFATAPRVAGPDGRPRVLVWNAYGDPLASEVALAELFDAGLVPVSAGAWPAVLDRSTIDGAGFFASGLSYGAAAAEALLLPDPELSGDTGTLSPVPTPAATPVPSMPAPDRTPWADVDLVFGTDYRPCPAANPTCLEEELP